MYSFIFPFFYFLFFIFYFLFFVLFFIFFIYLLIFFQLYSSIHIFYLFHFALFYFILFYLFHLISFYSISFCFISPYFIFLPFRCISRHSIRVILIMIPLRSAGCSIHLSFSFFNILSHLNSCLFIYSCI